MTPPVEPALEIGQQVPSLLGAALRMGAAVLVLALVAGAWIYWQRSRKPVSRRLEVIDRAFLSRGASVALLRIHDRELLVGVSNEGVRLLRDMEAEEQEEAPAPAVATFKQALLQSLGGRER